MKKPSTLIKVLEGISARSGRRPHEVFESFVKVSACALSAGCREAEYLTEIKRWAKDDQAAFAEAFALLVDRMEQSPFEDQLGDIHMELGSRSSQQWGGEFYTPVDVCRMMAGVLYSDASDLPADHVIQLLEPAAGSGRMVMAFAERLVEWSHSPLNMRVTCVDISALACDVCFVNLTLSSVPATVIHGNAISCESWAQHTNLLWYMARPINGSVAPTTAIPSIKDVAECQCQQMVLDFSEGAA